MHFMLTTTLLTLDTHQPRTLCPPQARLATVERKVVRQGAELVQGMDSIDSEAAGISAAAALSQHASAMKRIGGLDEAIAVLSIRLAEAATTLQQSPFGDSFRYSLQERFDQQLQELLSVEKGRKELEQQLAGAGGLP